MRAANSLPILALAFLCLLLDHSPARASGLRDLVPARDHISHPWVPARSARPPAHPRITSRPNTYNYDAPNGRGQALKHTRISTVAAQIISPKTHRRNDQTSATPNTHLYDPPWSSNWLSRDPLGEEGGLNLYGFVIQRDRLSIMKMVDAQETAWA
jgi:hypothetical protein